jgi:DNA-directed RNA polymerase specialized sigma24 family protein
LYTITHDEQVLNYQETGNSEKLVEQFHNFLNKYLYMLTSDNVDYSNYDLRCFLATFVQNKEVRKSLRRGKFHSKESVAVARKTLDYLRFKLRNHNQDELYAELVIPLLHCAQRYQPIGRSFEKYLYRAYKFYLKRHLDTIQLDAMDTYGTLYYGQFEEEIELLDELQEEQMFVLNPELDEGMELTDPRWISGKDCSEAFTPLKAHERYILAKYYYEKNTDKEIARMLPYNPKSIHRIRMRLREHFMDLYNQGELKWIRLIS